MHLDHYFFRVALVAIKLAVAVNYETIYSCIMDAKVQEAGRGTRIGNHCAFMYDNIGCVRVRRCLFGIINY